jgi:LysM repeat protein
LIAVNSSNKNMLMTIKEFTPHFHPIIFLLIFLLIPLFSAAQSTDRIHTVRPGETLFSISREYNITVDDLKSWNNIRNNTIIVGQRLNVGRPADTGQAIRHTVRSGETLMAVSRRYNIDVNVIKRVNNLQSDALRIGQVLIIPGDRYDPGTRSDSGTGDSATGRDSDPGSGTDLPGTELTEPVQRPVTETPAPAETSRPADTTDRQRERSLVLDRREGSTTYTVRPGDTLFRIADSHNMTIEQLRSLNNLRGDVIRVGQELIVRAGSGTESIGSESSSTFGRFTNHTVERGENLQDLLNRYFMDRVDFETLNPGTDPDRLRPGQIVTVLEPPASRQFNPYRTMVDVQDSNLTPVTRYSEAHTGRTTTNGELYNPDQLTAAHATLPLGSVVFVQNPENGRGIYVLVNDRIVDGSIRLSAQAYQSLDYAGSSRQAAVIVSTR